MRIIYAIWFGQMGLLRLLTETLGAVKCVGSQTGPVIREKVKELLVQRAGWDPNWRICTTTDGASNVVSSRSVSRHAFVGLTVVYETSCVDHTLHLVIEDALSNSTLCGMKTAIGKVRSLVDYFKQNSLAIQAFLQIQADLEMDVITPTQGTSNR